MAAAATMAEFTAKVVGARDGIVAGALALRDATQDSPPLRTPEDLGAVATLRQSLGLEPLCGLADNLGSYEMIVQRFLQGSDPEPPAPALVRRMVNVLSSLDGRIARLAAGQEDAALAMGLVPDAVRLAAAPVESPDGPTAVLVRASMVEALGLRAPASGWHVNAYGAAMACLGRGWGHGLSRARADWYMLSSVGPATEKFALAFRREQAEQQRRQDAEAQRQRDYAEMLRRNSMSDADRKCVELEARVRELEAQQAQAQPKA